MTPKRCRTGETVIGETISDYRISTRLESSKAYASYVADDLRDENRQRQVVLKILPSSLVGTEAARQRLAHAVRSITILNHPNICRLHRMETLDFRIVMVRDFADGESLRTRLKRGRVELDEAISIFVQIVRAIEAAHKRGVVHRNLKASNVFVANAIGGTPTVRIADFGFLHLLEPAASSLSVADDSRLTYRSPEEILGAVVDQRSDIWSLGVMLYEILTGTPPFQSTNAAAELLAILKDEHEPLNTLYPSYPRSLDWILSRCLAKNPNQRYETARELASELAILAEGKTVEERRSKAAPLETEPPAETEVQKAPQFVSHEERAFPWIATALVVGAIGLLSALLFLPRHSEIPRLRKYALAPAEFGGPEGRAVISPDGLSVAYIAGNDQTKLWIQDLSRDQPREIAGTDGATRPFWSHDGQWIGFLADSVIKKAAVSNGSIVEICPIGSMNDSFSASWGTDGTVIMFTAGSPSELFRVPAEGGQPKSFLQSVPGGGAPTFVHCLPSSFRLGRVLVASSRGADDVQAYDLRTGEHKSLGLRAASAVYSLTGHVLFQRSDAAATPLFAVPFSLESMETTGDAFSVQEGASRPSVSRQGTLAYRREGGPWLKQLFWFDRKGRNVGTAGKQWGSIRQVSLSRDGRRLGILASDEPGSTDGFWTYDQADTEWRASQTDYKVHSVALSASGDRALLSADVEGAVETYVRQISASRDDRRDQALRSNAAGCDVTDWSRYGRHIICNRTRDDGTSDLWRLTYDLDLGRFRESAVVESAFDERDGAISPDSRWLAFLSNQTGRHEVYVARFPGGDNAVQVSTEGASQPRWGRDSNELYYVRGSDLVSVALQTEPQLAVSARIVLFSNPGLASDSFSSDRHYDLDSGRERFLVASTVLANGGIPATIRIVENWIEEFQRRQ